MSSKPEIPFHPCFLATGVGSLPHADVGQACSFIARFFPETPFWPQLPQYSPLESMNLQGGVGLPFLGIEEAKGRLYFDASRDEARELERVYSFYLDGDPEAYRLPRRYAAGFEGMTEYLQERKPSPLRFFKGQIVGPITFGLAVQDDRGKDIIHREVIFDALVKALILRGRSVIRRMKKVCDRVIFFVDEPVLSGYGSAFFSVDEGTVKQRLNEVIAEYQAAGALVGVHCCGNTDWPLLLKTNADIINFDAWGFLERFSLFPEAIGGFLSRGGFLAWGIVPTAEFTGKETVEGLAGKLEDAFRELAGKGIREEILRERCLLTPSCGMSLMSVADAEKATGLLAELSRALRRKYFRSVL